MHTGPWEKFEVSKPHLSETDPITFKMKIMNLSKMPEFVTMFWKFNQIVAVAGRLNPYLVL